MPVSDLGPLFGTLPAEFADSYDAERPWELLGGPLDEVLAALPSEELAAPPGPGVHLIGDRIAIGKGTRILPGAVIEGPVRIGRDAVIRPGAYIRGGAWIGDGCVVGASSEVKHSILLPGARAPHLNYVGDSIVGSGVNLGAGTILSNFRFDGREVRIPIDGEPVATRRRKLGAVLGDRAQTGCNCVLAPGVIIGPGSFVFPGLSLPAGVYPGGHTIRGELRLDLRPRG